MADNFYSVKTALHVGIVQILGGLVGVGIGAFNTREEDHRAFFKFKPEGLPVWSGILVGMKINCAEFVLCVVLCWVGIFKMIPQ